MQAGRAEQKDFERHIYGQYGAKSYNRDRQDVQADEAHMEKKRIENEVRERIAAQTAAEGRQPLARN